MSHVKGQGLRHIHHSNLGTGRGGSIKFAEKVGGGEVIGCMPEKRNQYYRPMWVLGFRWKQHSRFGAFREGGGKD